MYWATIYIFFNTPTPDYEHGPLFEHGDECFFVLFFKALVPEISGRTLSEWASHTGKYK